MANEPAPSLDSVLQSANRKYGKNTIGVSESMEVLDMERIPSGIATLDEGLGGGFPRGQMVELYGPFSSGKSLISLLTIAQAQKQGLECIYFDIENSYDEIWAKALGVDTKKLIVTQIDIGEDVVDLCCNLLDASPGVLVIDSIAAITTRSEIENSADQKFIAPLARLLSYGLKRIKHHNKNTLIILVNQLREKITNFGSIPYTPGGNPILHYPSVRMEVKKDSEFITVSGKKTDPNIIGQICNWRIMKNKTAPPRKFGSFRYLYDGNKIVE